MGKSLIAKTAKNSKKDSWSGLNIHIPLLPAKTTEVYDTYWRFAVLRQEVFFNRIKQDIYPFTTDPILRQFKFTNAYRAADRVSQYLIRNVIYAEGYPNCPKELLFRILLFKLFNKIDTWELLQNQFGMLTLENYQFSKFDKILSKAIGSGRTIYSAAYIMPSGKSFFGHERKHSNHLKLIEMMLKLETQEKLAESRSMQKAFEIIKSFPGLGDFLAYQLLIDINYSPITNFSESEFVVPGPGANGGISKCFTDTGGLSNAEIIKVMTDRQEKEFDRLGLKFQNLWGRSLQLIDCQNLFCEVDKYARVKHPDIKGNSDRVRIKQVFRPTATPINYFFPPKWGINENIRQSINKS